MSRHAKTHATNDAEFVLFYFGWGSSLIDAFFLLASKLPCPLEGCKFRTLQKSNLVTHINRQ